MRTRRPIVRTVRRAARGRSPAISLLLLVLAAVGLNSVAVSAAEPHAKVFS